MAKQIRYDIKLNVDGKDVVASSVKDVKDLDKSVKTLSQYKGAFNDIVESSKPLKRQLAELKKLMAEMEFKGLAGTDEFKAIAQQAGAMADAIGDANAQVKYFANDTKVLSSVVGGFQAVASSIQLVQGAMALFGSENKAAAEMIKKVQGAMALANGVQQVANLLNKDSALIQGVVNMQRKLSAMLAKKNAAAIGAETAATKGATIATKAFNVVLKANPIGLVITAVTALVGALMLFNSTAEETNEEMKEMEVNGHDLSDEMGRMQLVQEETGKKAGELLSRYEELRMKFMSCKDEMAKTQFLEQNKSGFEALGLNIRSTADAMDYFVKKAPEMRQALMKIAIAQGMQEGLKQYVAKWSESQAKNPIRTPNIQPGFGVLLQELGSENDIEWTKEAGIGKGDYQRFDPGSQRFILNESGLRKASDYWDKYRARITKERQDEFLSNTKALTDYWMEAEESAMQAAAAVGIDYATGEIVSQKSGTPKAPKATKAPKAPSVSAPKMKTTTQKIKKDIQKDAKNIKQLDIPVDGMQLEFDGDFVITPGNFEKTMEDSIADANIKPAMPIIFDPQKAMSWDEKYAFDRKAAVHAGAESGIEDVKGWFNAGLIGKEKAQEFVDAFNFQLQKEGLEPIKVNFDIEETKKKLDNAKDTWSMTKSGLDGVSGALRGAGDAFKALGEDSAASYMQIGNALVGGIGQIIEAVMAQQALALSNGVASASELPFPANIAGIATIVGVILSTFAQIMSIGGFAEGGIIGGSSRSGDHVIARVNSGEMILNTVQQKRLFGMLNGSIPAASGSPTAALGMLRNSLNNGGNVTMTVSGRNLVGVLSNETRVSSRSGRKTNIKI